MPNVDQPGFFDMIPPAKTAGNQLRQDIPRGSLEAFYNLTVAPWFHLTTDIQMIRGGLECANTVLVVGFRGKIDF